MSKIEVKRTFTINIDTLFKGITNLFLNDYNSHSEISISEEEIENHLEYVMSFGSKEEKQAKVILKEYEVPNIYEIQVESNQGTVSISYHLKDLQKNQTEIAYREIRKASNRFLKINDYIMQFLMKRKLKEQMAENLNRIYQIALKLEKSDHYVV